MFKIFYEHIFDLKPSLANRPYLLLGAVETIEKEYMRLRHTTKVLAINEWSSNSGAKN